MELIWKEISPARLAGRSNTSVLIEGALPPPDNRPVTAVLCCSAKTSIEQTSVDSDHVDIVGTLTARITAQSADGNIFVFESEAEFEHSEDLIGAVPGMTADIKAVVSSIETEINNGSISFSAKISLDISILSRMPLRVLDGINGVNDLEFKYSNITCSDRSLIGTRTLRMREELAESGITQVLSCSGTATVRDIVCDGSGYSVGGVLTVNALTLDADGRAAGIVRQLPFRELLDVKPTLADTYCTAEVKNLSIHALGEEFALLAMEAEVCFKIYKAEKSELALPIDAFSPSFGFDCLNERIMLFNDYGSASASVQIKEESIIPESMTDIAMCIYALAEPIITAVEADIGIICISGIIKASIIYQSSAGNKYTYTDEIPFNAEMNNTCGCNSPSINCSCSTQITGYSERAVQLSFILQFEAELNDIVQVDTVVGLAEKEILRNTGSLIIAFTSKGDTLFDIAKRYSVSTESLIRLNPEANDALNEGDRLLILR